MLSPSVVVVRRPVGRPALYVLRVLALDRPAAGRRRRLLVKRLVVKPLVPARRLASLGVALSQLRLELFVLLVVRLLVRRPEGRDRVAGLLRVPLVADGVDRLRQVVARLAARVVP